MSSLADADFAVCELSPMLQQLVEVVGMVAAMQLVDQYGGIDLLVPAKYLPQHPLVKLLGEDAARKLIHHHTGERIYVPRGAKALRCVRNRAIIQAYDEGQGSAAVLALQYHLSERQVRTILNTPDAPTGGMRQLAFEFD